MPGFTRFIILFISLLLVHNIGITQVSDSLFNLSCQHEAIIILNEDLEVYISGEKIYTMTVNIKSDLTFVVKKEEGLADFQPYRLPKKFDELYIYHAPEIRNIEWAYDNIYVQEFNAYYASTGEDRVKIPIRKKVSKKRVLDDKGFFGNTNIYEYYFDGLKVGDTVQITYEYNIAFKDNWIRLLSNRLFFHGKYPKKKYQLKWCYYANLEVDSVFINHDPLDVNVEDKKLCYEWTFNNLPGCLDEPGSRPYKTLPHFVFVPKPYDLEYTQFDSYKYEFIPIYYFEANKKQKELYIEYWDNTIGNKNKNNLHYQKLADKIISLAPDDTIGNQKLRYFQQFMVDSVTYKNAYGYYNHDEDNRKQRAGVELNAYKVNDNNLERVYGNMIPKLGLDFFTVYPVDIRAGVISRLYNSTILDNDLLYAAIMKDNNLALVVPKSDKNNYYFEEVPFYYEGIPVCLLHHFDYANPSINDGAGKRNFNTEFREWITPISQLKDNYRKVQSQVKIGLENNTTVFKTRVLLSGQYSTLSRCVYCEKPVDSTINLKYLDPIWNIAENVNVKAVKSQHPFIYYPFKTTIIIDYEVSDILEKKNGKYVLMPGKWLKIVFSDGLKNGPRFLDYYPDFVGSDTYTYLLEFDSPVKLDSNYGPVMLTNDYGHFNFLVTQPAMNKILINCKYIVKARLVDKESIDIVKEINQAIKSIDFKEIVFEVLPN